MALVKITAKFNMAGVEKLLKERYKQARLAVIEKFVQVGKKCVDEARAIGSYNNITHNLRSSIAYGIYDDGIRIREDFKLSGDGGKGLVDADNYLNELAVNAPKGIVLIMVAAEKYAIHVETRGRIVCFSLMLKSRMEDFISTNVRPDQQKKMWL